MPSRPKKDPIFTPELIRIMKIFGLISILIVLGLSFFNTRRASNSGKDQTFRMSDSARLYFLNVRAIKYERELRKDAGMTLYRHDKRNKEPGTSTLDLVLILNPLQDEAYIYLEPRGIDWPIRIKIQPPVGQSRELTLENGDKNTHMRHVKTLEEGIRSGAQFALRKDQVWVDLWNEPGELDYLETMLNDYQTLTE